jgi:hypothetical protein
VPLGSLENLLEKLLPECLRESFRESIIESLRGSLKKSLKQSQVVLLEDRFESSSLGIFWILQKRKIIKFSAKKISPLFSNISVVVSLYGP